MDRRTALATIASTALIPLVGLPEFVVGGCPVRQEVLHVFGPVGAPAEWMEKMVEAIEYCRDKHPSLSLENLLEWLPEFRDDLIVRGLHEGVGPWDKFPI